MLVTLDRLIAAAADRVFPPSDSGSFSYPATPPSVWKPRTWAQRYRDGFRHREQQRCQGLRVPTARPMGPDDQLP